MFFLQIRKLEDERDQWKQYFDPMKRKLKELEESESGMRISLEKAERDAKALKELNANLLTKYTQADNETKKSEAAVRTLNNKFKVCITNYSASSSHSIFLYKRFIDHSKRKN